MNKKSSLKHLPINYPVNLASLIHPKENQVLSMALSDSDKVQMSLFSFSTGETVSEEKYLGDTMYLMIEGETKLRFEDREVIMQEGDVLSIPAMVGHEIGGGKSFKILQITLLNDL